MKLLSLSLSLSLLLLLSPPPYPSPLFLGQHSILAAATVATKLPSLPSKASAAAIAVAVSNPTSSCRRCRQLKPTIPPLLLPPPFPSPTLHQRRSTLIASQPLPPSEARTPAIAFSAALLVAAVSPSLFQPRCRHCCHHVAIIANQSPLCCRCCRHSFTVTVPPLSCRRCCHQTKPTPLLSLLPTTYLSPPFLCSHSILATATVTTALRFLPSEARATDVASATP